MNDASFAPAGEPPNLLLVERDAAMRLVLGKVLSTHYRVEAFGDGSEAYEASKLRAPAVVIIDLSLPGTDHLSLIQNLRGEARTAHLPIIMLATGLHRDLLLRCLAAGATHFLLKPFGVTELLTRANEDIPLRRTHAEPGT